MTAVAAPDELRIDIHETIIINAPIETAFQAMIDELSVHNHAGGDDKPMPMVLEQFPGGRWFRDLDNNDGHCWGLVQAIKKPTLLEITGPLFMSYAVSNNVQYRLKETDTGTELTFRHSGFGLIDPEHREGLSQGWGHMLTRIQKRAEK